LLRNKTKGDGKRPAKKKDGRDGFHLVHSFNQPQDEQIKRAKQDFVGNLQTEDKGIDPTLLQVFLF